MRHLTHKQGSLLAFLTLGSRVPQRLELVKWAFLFAKEFPHADEYPKYDFLPYRLGPFSFELYKDLSDLVSRGLVTQDLNVPRRSQRAVELNIARLTNSTLDSIQSTIANYERLSTAVLLGHVYERYAWYATRSEMVPHGRVGNSDPRIIYTKGYEGLSIDAYFNNLLENGVTQLVDVRSNPFSHKYGFSKIPLSRICSKLGIEYVPRPELGIPSNRRKELAKNESVGKLLDWYKDSALSSRIVKDSTRRLSADTTSFCLMCFEAQSDQCHRSVLADTIANRVSVTIRHL